MEHKEKICGCIYFTLSRFNNRDLFPKCYGDGRKDTDPYYNFVDLDGFIYFLHEKKIRKRKEFDNLKK
jgi:hypothetical protein